MQIYLHYKRYICIISDGIEIDKQPSKDVMTDPNKNRQCRCFFNVYSLDVCQAQIQKVLFLFFRAESGSIFPAPLKKEHLSLILYTQTSDRLLFPLPRSLQPHTLDSDNSFDVPQNLSDGYVPLPHKVHAELHFLPHNNPSDQRLLPLRCICRDL